MPASPSAGMPGGSWILDEEEQTEGFEPHHPVIMLAENSPLSPQSSSALIQALQGPYKIFIQESQEPYQIVVLDPAELSEEISLLASPSPAASASRETWRVRISPEYDIEVLPPDPQRERNGAVGRQIRDSPEQRRSRFLDNIFPEIKDDIHPFSRCPTDNNLVAPTFDVEWDFNQDGPSSALDSSATSEEDLRTSAETSETLPVLGLTFPSTSLVDNLRPSSPSPSSVDRSSLADVDLSSCDRPIPVPDASAPSNGENARIGAENPENVPALGLTFSFTSSVDREEAERASSRSPSSVGSSFDDIDLGSPSPPVTSISMPSTARPLSSPSESDCTLRTDTPSSGFADSDVEDLDSLQVEASTGDPDAQTPSTAIHERHDDESAPDNTSVHSHSDSASPRHESTADDPFLRPQCTLFDSTAVADGHDSDSLPSLLIRPATASVFSDDEEGGDERLEEADAERQSEHLELQYLDEYQYPALTPLSLLGFEEISLPLSLDNTFEFFNDWEVVPFYRSQDALFGSDAVVQPVVPSGNPPSAAIAADAVSCGANDTDAFAKGAELSLEVRSQNALVVPSGSPSSAAVESEDLHGGANDTDASAEGAEPPLEVVEASSDEPPLHSPPLADAGSSVADAQAPSDVLRSDAEDHSLVALVAVLDTNGYVDPQNRTVAVDDEGEKAFPSPSSLAASADHRFEDEFRGVPELPALQFHLTSFPGADDLAAGPYASLDALRVGPFTAASAIVSQASQTTPAKHGLETPAEEQDRRPHSPSTDDEALRTPPTPALPALHFPCPSLTDEVLSSPVFRLLDCDTMGSGSIAAARTTARHVRALTTSHVERRSILWAPHDTRDLHDGRRASVHAGSKDKGKARPRARTLSFADDSRSRHGSEQRVEREVQTEVPVARDAVKRLKQKLRAERAKIAGLVRERNKSAEYERWQASWERKWQYFGGFSYDFEDGLM
ncbi:hypothetical protein DFH06DRAFT_766784 [Mycena polygramma]|nr:hypothetical protein DFH06DRAFT_766784 [Mycena polygramma]